METVLIALGAFVLYIIAYRTYGRYLARKIFTLDPDRTPPSRELEDGVDYVPSKREMVFGHHFTSIAGTGPIVGPAVAVAWGWVPALLWVLIGSIVMGAVHDFGSLVISMRHKGRTIADLSKDVINPRVRWLFLIVVLVGLWVVLAVFGLVIAAVFARFPTSVAPVWLQIPIAIGLGVWLRRGGSLLLGSVVAVGLMYATIAVSANYEWAQVVLPASITDQISPAAFWTIMLLIYVFIASVLPVQTLLQPRDFINSWQLLIAMGLLLIGLLIARPPIVGEALVMRPEPATAGAYVPPFLPFLFVTIACGAISGFHCLVASGCSSRQLSTERDAQYVGYGAMLTEGFLATLVILACVAGIGLGETQWEVSALQATIANAGGSSPFDQAPMPESTTFDFQISPYPDSVIATTSGAGSWQYYYNTWGGDKGLGDKLEPFIRGSANMIESIGISSALAIAIMGVFVASFAATTLDSATRLQRYVIAELAGGGRIGSESRSTQLCRACGYNLFQLDHDTCPECGMEDARVVRPDIGSESRSTQIRGMITNRYVATGIAIVTAAALALSDIPAKGLAGAGAGGLILWPIFGATNQLLGGLALLVLTVWLVRTDKPFWVTAIPMAFMLAMTGWAITDMILGFAGADGKTHLLVISILMLALEIWIVLEAAAFVLSGRARNGAVA